MNVSLRATEIPNQKVRRKVKIRRRPPSDARALRHITDPGIGKATAVGALLLGALGFGIWLVLRGLN